MSKQKELLGILEEIEHRARRAQYNSEIQDRINETDVPLLVESNRVLLKFAQLMTHYPEFTKEAQRAIDGITAILNGELDFSCTEYFQNLPKKPILVIQQTVGR